MFYLQSMEEPWKGSDTIGIESLDNAVPWGMDGRLALVEAGKASGGK